MSRFNLWFCLVLVSCAAPSYSSDSPGHGISENFADVLGAGDGADATCCFCCETGNAMATVTAQEPPAYASWWGTAPDDGTQVKAADVRQLAQAAFTHDAFIRVKRASWTYDVESPAFTYNTFSQDVYESPISGGYIEFPGAKIGDTILARLTCLAQNGDPSTGNGNRLRLAAIDDYGGGSETAAAAVPGARVYINAPDEQITSVTLEGEYVVTVDGVTRIYMQGRVDTEPGSLRIQSAAYLYGEHRRAATESITP